MDLWPEEDRPAVEYTHDIDDWLAAITTGRCIGLTPGPPPPSTVATASPTALSVAPSRYPSVSSGAPTPPTPQLTQ
ncbi:hypothetical protein GCM10015535_42280 [Streptomyces gelaticus]|uniref:Uncharacterized protein n=1 Tax=Streptomyces gelaticus TaxID=285446 RepID=A0ABQ2W508_9ACTN|nr:hypothetical protein GCM10015535_42280 [Streptomyces gelaticus]